MTCSRTEFPTIRYPTVFFFFFQAEDGIRDLTVTGVQTCALPILPALSHDVAAGNRDERAVMGDAVLVRSLRRRQLVVALERHRRARDGEDRVRDRKSVV